MKASAPRDLAVAAALFVTLACGGSSAVAAEGGGFPPAEVEAILPDCPAAYLDRHGTLAALKLELVHDGVSRISLVPSRGENVVSIEIVLDCQPAARQVLLRIRSAAGKEVDRAMDIADLPGWLRARAVALAGAELARSIWSSAPASDEGSAESGDSAKGAGDAAVAKKDLARAAASPSAAEPPATSAPVVAPASPARTRPRGPSIAVGPAARWFMSASSPLFGGRVAGSTGRWRAGADVLWGYDPRFAVTTKLGLAVGWVALDLISIEREGWHLLAAPRLAAGAGWSRTPPTNKEIPLTGTPPTAQPAGQSTQTSGFYVEGALVGMVLARTRAGWLVGLSVEVCIGRGLTPESDSPRPGTRPSAGANLLVGREF